MTNAHLLRKGYLWCYIPARYCQFDKIDWSTLGLHFRGCIWGQTHCGTRGDSVGQGLT